jgi:hypothetical protein
MAGSGTPLASRCDVCVWRREWRLVPFGSFSRRNSSDTAADIESRLNGVPLKFREYQVQVGAIVGSELESELLLALPMGAQGRNGRHRQAHRTRLVGLGALELESISRLRERPGDHGTTVLDIAPT